ncbi:MAG: hypothetical protein KO463_08135 [Candidatus Methanofastidiosa archaeon]|nr:hypothetical protein [Candidatus Methanofastidiosa archaeon]
MVNVKQYLEAGVDDIYYGARDSAGYLIGNTATAPAAGNQDGAAMALLEGIKTVPLALQEVERVNITGSNRALGVRQFNPIELPSGTPTLGTADMVFAALAMNLTLAEIGAFTFLGLQPSELSFQDLILMTVNAGTSRASGSEGSTIYTGKIVLAAQCFWQDDAGMTERQAVDYQFSVTAQYGARFPWGLALPGSVQYAAVRYTSLYKPMIQRWTGDGVETDFNLAKDLAEDSADNIAVYVDGVAQTWVTGVPGAGEFGVTLNTAPTEDVIVLGTAPADGAKVVAIYGWK